MVRFYGGCGLRPRLEEVLQREQLHYGEMEDTKRSHFKSYVVTQSETHKHEDFSSQRQQKLNTSLQVHDANR